MNRYQLRPGNAGPLFALLLLAFGALPRAGQANTPVLAGGDAHTCALNAAGGVLCWGANGTGQLGDGAYGIRLWANIPLNVHGLASGVTTLAAGHSHTCALLGDGSVQCWGNGNSGQLGYGGNSSTWLPTAVQGLNGSAIAIAAGYGHTCALINGGSVYCWGLNNFGQLGDGTNNSSNKPGIAVALAGPATAIAAGQYHTCAVLSAGGVQCWGQGPLGNGTGSDSSTPVNVNLGGATATGVAVGARHICVLISGGTVRCWGDDTHGQLGDGTTSSNYNLVTVKNLSGATSITAGSDHTCATAGFAGAVCWGSNVHGQIGDGGSTDRTTPFSLSGIGLVAGITAGWRHTCAQAVTGSGGLSFKCWGDDRDAQLGDKAAFERVQPTSVAALSGATHIATGGGHSCVRTGIGGVRCWGDNAYGQLGNSNSLDSSTYVPVTGISTATAVVTGGQHSCALLSGGTVTCWGNNPYGQLGDNTTNAKSTPVPVMNVSNAVALGAGYGHTCALISGGTVKCWGWNYAKQLGDGTQTNRPLAVNVQGVSGATAIAIGWDHNCALLGGGAVMCWGSNQYGQMGIGSTGPDSPAVLIGSLTGVTAVVAGNGYSCALLGGGTARCWGWNLYGQLGNNDTANSSVPIPVFGMSGATALSAGRGHACAILGSGAAAACWGYNQYAQLGDGTHTNRPIPVSVSNLTNIAMLSAGNYHTCAVQTPGQTAQCWGADNHGQLGNGRSLWQRSPVGVVDVLFRDQFE